MPVPIAITRPSNECKVTQQGPSMRAQMGTSFSPCETHKKGIRAVEGSMLFDKGSLRTVPH
jgi:hypothetical protein